MERGTTQKTSSLQQQGYAMKKPTQQRTTVTNPTQQRTKQQQGYAMKKTTQQRAVTTSNNQSSTQQTLQKLQVASELSTLQKMNQKKPAPSGGGGGSFLMNIIMGIMIAVFALLCVVGYYIWYFLTHPLDDVKGMFHL